MGKPLRDHAYDAAMVALAPMERVIMQTSLVPIRPFLDPAEQPWTATLEAGWRDIREELDGVLRYHEDLPAFHEITADVSDISDENWRTFIFCGYGFQSDVNRARCPRTAELLDQVPDLVTAFFSILAPGKRIPPHRGPWRGVLRYHLGLKVPGPEAACGIRVGGEVAHWTEGGSLLFDDCYEHAAWNDTGETRVVLFLDVLRPCRAPGSWVNRGVIRAVGLSPFVRDARRKHNAWERRVAARHPEWARPREAVAATGDRLTDRRAS